MNYTWGVCESVVLGSILSLSFCATASAQEQPPATAQVQPPASEVAKVTNPAPASSSVAAPQSQAPSDSAPAWRFQSLSYLWFPGMNGTVGARGYSASAHVSASDLFQNLNIGIMGSFEAQYGRWGIPFDYVWANVSDSKALLNVPGYSAKATVKEGFLTPKVTYVVMDSERARVQATAGIRYWHLGQNLQLTPNTNNISFGTSQNWVDVVAGARITVPLSRKIALTALGDAGAGGANVDYQVATFVGYQIKPKYAVGVGYRYVDVNYRNSNRFIFDAAQSGIAFTLLYKYGKPRE
jgi:hypothetical protein